MFRLHRDITGRFTGFRLHWPVDVTFAIHPAPRGFAMLGIDGVGVWCLSSHVLDTPYRILWLGESLALGFMPWVDVISPAPSTAELDARWDEGERLAADQARYRLRNRSAPKHSTQIPLTVAHPSG